MSEYVLLADGASDLPKGTAQSIGLRVIPMTITKDGGVQLASTDVIAEEMYAELRLGKSYKTSAISIGTFADCFEEILAEGKDILYLCFSSAMSSTYRNAVFAASEAEAKFPGRHILVVDTKSASLGIGYMAILAARKKATGARLEECAAYIEELVPMVAHQFTVDDLFFLKRGGRVSAATAVLGTMMQFKPMLHVNDDGKLVNVGKVRGRKAAIAALVDKMEATWLPDKTEIVGICHGDCGEDARALEEMVRARLGVEEVYTCTVGPTIGAHAGPNVLALFYIAEGR